MSSSGRRRIDEIGDESRRRILDAAEELFAERGFERTSFVDIAERSGISRGSIPWHFKNKEGLVMAVVERAVDRFLGPARYDSVPSLSELVHDYATWVRSGNSALMFSVLTEAMNSSGAVHAQYREFLEQRRSGVESWLRAQRPEGVDPAVAAEKERAVAIILTGAVTGIHLQSVVDPDGVDLEEALRSLVTLVGGSVADLWTGSTPDEPPAAKKRGSGSRKRTG
ncbi:TetR family transcriptional regulator [Goodfellowiella coeruleoviolacea]|uniref:TetR family transcriptional regulator n=1 Tax=Goodfellowiella coeruleoviolacea TaxID=334858 RepID=UPI000A4ECEB0|nr:TetR/AcrR family transcriptional regulator [Goodfellowiella coeruleoviolacea]